MLITTFRSISVQGIKLNSCQFSRFSGFTSHNSSRVEARFRSDKSVTIIFVMTDAVEIVGEVGSALTGRQNRQQGIALEQNVTTFAGMVRGGRKITFCF